MYLVDWFPLDKHDVVVLLYSDGSYLLVPREKFNQSFGPIVSVSKDVVQQNFAVDIFKVFFGKGE